MTPPEAAPDLCWLCSKPLEPGPDGEERLCPHCQALNKPHTGTAAPPEMVPETERKCRLCAEKLEASPDNPRWVCSNCGEVNAPRGLAQTAAPDPEADEEEYSDEATYRLYGTTLGVTPAAAGGLLALLLTAGLLGTTGGHGADILLTGGLTYGFLSVAAFMATVWKRFSAGPEAGSLVVGSAVKSWFLSSVALVAGLGLVSVLFVLVFRRPY